MSLLQGVNTQVFVCLCVSLAITDKNDPKNSLTQKSDRVRQIHLHCSLCKAMTYKNDAIGRDIKTQNSHSLKVAGLIPRLRVPRVPAKSPDAAGGQSDCFALASQF